ncbi:MAG: hypothetical protein J6W94_01515 [Bacteroidales bacterium]|nr:hypothetical protein [Bacteroidales bacterium]
MKKVFYILLAAAACLVSCSKEVPTNNEIPVEPIVKTGKTITFSASIDLNTKTKAALDGLNINWQSGDYIGIATDNNATIVAYPVTVDGSDATKCTITVDEVAGATAYYAIFKGSLGDGGANVNSRAADDFSDISFDTATKTFTGLKVGNQQVASEPLSSYLWYTNGFPLAMAGKTDGTTLSMKPCLALFKVQIHADSVPDAYYFTTDTYTSTYSVNHDHNYSAVRGFNLYQMAGSTVYSSGDYNVQVGGDGSLTVTNGENKTQYRQISQSGKLTAGTPYYMCLIPGGDITSMKLDFLGYSDNTPTLSWDAVYTMSLAPAGGLTVAPGDFYNLGTVNPLGRKKAKNEAADEAEDEAAASYVPAITIDGDISDWTGIAAQPSDNTSRIREWKFKSDSQKVYFYFSFRKNRVDSARNLYVGFDTDNSSSTGSSYGSVSGCEAYIKVVPFVNVGEATTPEPVVGFDANSVVYASGVGTNNGAVYCYSYDDGSDLGSSSSNIYLEISVDRNKLNLPAAGSNVTIGCSYDWYVTGTQVLAME